MNIQNKIKEVLAAHKLAALATTDPDTLQPESALVAYAEDERLNLYFQTSQLSRKMKNLRRNQKVALVIGFGHLTVQYEGTAQRLTAKEQIGRAAELFESKKSPTTQDYFDKPDTAVFKVIPTWIGYSDYTKRPPEVLELIDRDR